MVLGVRPRYSIACAVLGTATAALFIGSPATSATEEPPALFTPVDTSAVDLTPKQNKVLERIDKSKGTVPGTRRVVRVAADATTAVADTPFAVTLPQGNKVGVTPRVAVRASGTDAKSTFLAGSNSQSTEAVYLDLTDKAATGLIYTADKVFAVEPIGGGLQAVTELDMSKFDMHDHGGKFKEIEKKQIDVSQLQPPPAAGAPPTEITVLVAYTPQVEALQANVQSLINSAVALANTSYGNSQVNIKLTLVGTHKVDYNEAGKTHEAALAAFQTNGDQVMDEIHALRNQLKADVCVLLIDNDQFCGLAAAILANPDTAFAVVHHDCAVKNISFAHEIGHLQGARHNLEVDPTIDASHPYNHGYLSPGAANWRTIMAYPATGKPNRIPYWSNPGVKFGGIPMGTAANNNNARMLNETAKTISLFR